MTSRILLSPIEHKMLLGFVFLICCVFYLNFSHRIIGSYNKNVEFEQKQQQEESNNPKLKAIRFGISDISSPLTIYEYVFWLQILTNPLSFFLLQKQKIRRFIFSTTLTLFTFLSFLNWAFSTYSRNSTNEIPFSKDVNLSQYFFYDSNILEVFLGTLISILLTIQVSILLRFVIEKFQVKIS